MFPFWNHQWYFLYMKLALPNISLSDLDLFFRVAKLKSLRECARQLDMSPGAVSKIIKRLEENLGKTLLRRSASGVLLTADGNELLIMAEKILQITLPISTPIGKKSLIQKVWSIGSLSFICTRLLPPILEDLSATRSRTKFRLVELGGPQLIAQGLNGAFEMAIHIGPMEWTKAWSSHEVGNLKWGLYARANHPLEKIKELSSEAVTQFPFVMPTSWSSQGFIRGDDHCPIPWGVRMAGHEATTGEAALEIVSQSLHLAFVPEILARKPVEFKTLVQLEVLDWPIVEKKLFLSVRDDLIPSHLLQSIIQLINKQLSKV